MSKNLKKWLVVFWVCFGAVVTALGDSFQVSMDFNAPEISVNGGGWVQVMVDDCKLSNEEGVPMLPVKTVRYALPPTVDLDSVRVSVTKADYDSSTLSAAVQPGFPMRPALNKTPMVAQADSTIYSQDVFLNENSVEILNFPRMRDWRMVELLVQAAQYNPVQGVVRTLRHLEFTVEYKLSSSLRSAAASSDDILHDDALRMVENGASASAWYSIGRRLASTTSSTSDVYVIITSDTIYNSSPTLYGFTTHKTSRGYQVHVVTETRVDGQTTATGWNEVTGQAPNDKADRIRKWLQNNYQSMGIKYVLLVGNPHPDQGDVPMKMCWPNYSSTSYRECPTDYYFADLTGNWDSNGNQIYGEEYVDVDINGVGGVDFTPEVYVGRFPVYSTTDFTELQQIIQKTIQYENASSTEWRRNVLLPVAFLDQNTDEANIAEDMKEDYLLTNGYSAYTLYEQGSVNSNYNSIFTSNEELLNNATVNHWKNHSYGMTLWMGHGWYGGAVIYSGGTLFSYDQCPQLNNNTPSVVYMGSCSCGEPEYQQNTAYQMLLNGGIATYGASRVSWYAGLWDPDLHTHLDIAGIGYTMFKYISTRGYTFSEALYTTMATMHGGAATGWWMNRMDFNLYGDPSLTLNVHMTDTDNDGLSDGWETEYGLNPNDPSDAVQDLDADSLNHLAEFSRGTNPRRADTDLDGLRDDVDAAPLQAAYLQYTVPTQTRGYVARESRTGYDVWWWFSGSPIWQDDEYIYNSVLYDDRGMLGFSLYSLPQGAIIRGANLIYRSPTSSNTNATLAVRLVALGDPDVWSQAGLENIFNQVETNAALQTTPTGTFPLRSSNEEALWLNADVVSNMISRRSAASWSIGLGYAQPSTRQSRLDSAYLVVSYEVLQSSYSSMSLAGTFNGWNPASSNMHLVSNYVWQADVMLSTNGGVEFKITANGNWSVNWGESNQSDRDVPMQAWAEQGQGNIAANGPLSGVYRFTFNEQTWEYSMVRLPDPDADGDGIPDAWETAHGLNPNNAADAALDPDGDGFTNLQEYQNGTDPQVFNQIVYTSAYTNMSLAGTFNGWNQAAGNMILISNYTWRADLTLTNASGVAFKFAANKSWTVNWGDANQSDRDLPMQSWTELGAANIAINGTLNGTYRFIFNEQSYVYSVERLPDPDADGDGMPDAWEIAHGLNPNNSSDATQDPDGDGYTNLQEYQNGTDPWVGNFLSNYSSMTVAATFQGWDPAANNMHLIGHYTWAADIVLNNATGVRFKFAANGSWTMNWGEWNQSDYDLPISGLVEQNNNDIYINGTLSGTYRFIYNEQTRDYSVTLVSASVEDADADGMGDAWESAYALQSSGLDADGDGLANKAEFALGGNPLVADTDNDGSSDYEEYVAGSVLTDRDSWFGVNVEPAQSGVTISWIGKAGRTYNVYRLNSLVGGEWTLVQSDIAGQDGYMSIQDADNAVSSSFYRVEVRDAVPSIAQ
jgi:hypothetical protein